MKPFFVTIALKIKETQHICVGAARRSCWLLTQMDIVENDRFVTKI